MHDPIADVVLWTAVLAVCAAAVLSLVVHYHRTK